MWVLVYSSVSVNSPYEVTDFSNEVTCWYPKIVLRIFEVSLKYCLDCPLFSFSCHIILVLSYHISFFFSGLSCWSAQTGMLDGPSVRFCLVLYRIMSTQGHPRWVDWSCNICISVVQYRLNYYILIHAKFILIHISSLIWFLRIMYLVITSIWIGVVNGLLSCGKSLDSSSSCYFSRLVISVASCVPDLSGLALFPRMMVVACRGRVRCVW